MIRLDVSVDGLTDIAATLAATEKQARAALASTLPKMAAWVRARSVPGLSAAAGIPQRVVRRRMKSLRLTKNSAGSEITVWYGLNPVALIYLQAKQNGSGVKATGGRFVSSGFIAAPRNGKRQVFKRRSNARLPIEKQVAEIEDKATTYLEDKLIGTAEFNDRFMTVFERELRWRMQTLS